jgi:hypothetical protein
MLHNNRLARFKERFEDLKFLPMYENGVWNTKIRNWEEFLKKGEETAKILREDRAILDPEDYEVEVRAVAPDLHDLLMEAFPEPRRVMFIP